MFCPRCGTQNEEGDRFCVSCGASLRKPPPDAERRSLRQRLDRLIGSTPRARALTAGTAAAIVVAIIAFVAIPAAKDAPDDPFTLSADQICLQSKQGIAAVSRQIPPSAGPGQFAGALVPIVAGWRFRFNNLPVPDDKLDRARRLNLALREVEILAGTIAVDSEKGDTGALLPLGKRADEASAQVENAIDDLDLPQCRDIAVGLVKAPPSGE